MTDAQPRTDAVATATATGMAPQVSEQVPHSETELGAASARVEWPATPALATTAAAAAQDDEFEADSEGDGDSDGDGDGDGHAPSFVESGFQSRVDYEEWLAHYDGWLVESEGTPAAPVARSAAQTTTATTATAAKRTYIFGALATAATATTATSTTAANNNNHAEQAAAASTIAADKGTTAPATNPKWMFIGDDGVASTSQVSGLGLSFAWADRIPHHVLERVFFFLDVADFGRARCSCTRWRNIGISSAMLRKRFDGQIHTLMQAKGLIKSSYRFIPNSSAFNLAKEVRLWRERVGPGMTEPHQDDVGSAGAGKVIVCVRKRPTLASLGEVAVFSQGTHVGPGAPDGMFDNYPNCDVITAYNPKVYVHRPEERFGRPTGKLHSPGWTFDHTFGGDADNSEVYTAIVKPLVKMTLDGCVSTVLAFGQTGSGKTYTRTSMQQMACREMFMLLQAALEAGKRRFVTCSFFENCGEHCYDLLNDRTQLQVRSAVKAGETEERVHVVGLTEITVNTADEALALMQAGSQLRTTHPTERNPDSSRSHAICTLALHTHGAGPEEHAGMLRVVDLAGSERREDVYGHDADRIKEMRDINWSLGCLKECIRGLFVRETANPEEHIKFRNCKLTLILRDIFTSASHRTVFISCIAPLQRDWRHTRSTLGYTSKLKLIDDVRHRREVSDDELCLELLRFYKQHNKKLASKGKVAGVLDKFKGTEAQLYHKLMQRYRDAPLALLMRGPAKETDSKWPGNWTRTQVKAFITDLFPEYVEKFNCTGSQMLLMDNKTMQRRCGGRWSCAAFSERLEQDDAGQSNIKLYKHKMARHLDSRCVLVPAPWVLGPKHVSNPALKKFKPHLLYYYFFPGLSEEEQATQLAKALEGEHAGKAASTILTPCPYAPIKALEGEHAGTSMSKYNIAPPFFFKRRKIWI